MIEAAAGVSECGPRSRNEDCYAFWTVGSTFYAAVADGLGGMEGGAQASQFVIEFLKTRTADEPAQPTGLIELVHRAHRGLVELQAEQPQFRTMATTVTIVAVEGRDLAGAHCGDTRLYLARQNGIKRLSEDHSEGERLYREGIISRRELAEYPRKHILESALGVKGEPSIQRIEFSLLPGDWLLLASDGAYAKLATTELRDLCKSLVSPDDMVRACEALIRDRTPTDNYTLLAVKVGHDAGPAAQ